MIVTAFSKITETSTRESLSSDLVVKWLKSQTPDVRLGFRIPLYSLVEDHNSLLSLHKTVPRALQDCERAWKRNLVCKFATEEKKSMQFFPLSVDHDLRM